MPLFADQTAETFRVEFADGDWIEVRSTITVGDRKAANAGAYGRSVTYKTPTRSDRSTRRRGDDEDVEAKVEFSATGYSIALLERMITFWSELVPVTIENIERLPQTYIARLMEELDTRNEPIDGEAAGPLSSSSQASSTQPDTSSDLSRGQES